MGYFLPKMIRKVLNKPAIRYSKIDKTAKCDIGCNVTASSLGRYSYLGEFTSLSFTDVGSFTSISAKCSIGGGSHPLEWVSMSPVFQNSRGIMRKKLASHNYSAYKRTIIGNDVWIGAGCYIKGGVKINDGAVIGMGSVVTRDVGPYEIWAGNPAKLIRKRFDDEIIDKLLEIKWWNSSENEIEILAKHILDVNSFIEQFKSIHEML